MSPILIPVLPREMGRYRVGDKYVETLKHNLYPALYCHPLDRWDIDRRLNWDRYIHREGLPYYYNKIKQVVTFCDIVDDDVNDCVKAVIEEIKRRMRQHLAPECVERGFPTERPDVTVQWDEWHYGVLEWELCLKIDTTTNECQYYIADWNKRCLFWLEERPENLSPEDPNVLNTKKLGMLAPASYYHMRSSLEGQFWKHVEFFPEHRDLPQGSFEELKAWFLWGITDRKTSHDSTIGYEAKDMELFLQMLTSQKWDDPQSRGYLSTVVARHWAEIWNDRSHNMFGEHTARLSRDQSRYFEPLNRKAPCFIARALSCIFLFNKPLSRYTRLCELWVDKTIFLDTWRQTMQEVQTECTKTGILSMFVLIANMLFLAVNPLGGSSRISSLLNIVSTIIAIGSVLSAALISQDHAEMSQPTFTLDRAQSYLAKSDKYSFGLFGTAMFYSLPSAMLLWSVVTSVAAVLTFAFAKSRFFESPLVALIAAVVFLLIAGQIVFFHCGRREYKGSTWTLPPDNEEIYPTPSEVLANEQFSVETPRRRNMVHSAAEGVSSLIKRGSTVLLKGCCWSVERTDRAAEDVCHEKSSTPYFLSAPLHGVDLKSVEPYYDEPLDLPVHQTHVETVATSQSYYPGQEHQANPLATMRRPQSPSAIDWMNFFRGESAIQILPGPFGN